MRIGLLPPSEKHIAVIGPKGIPKDFSGSGGIEAYVEHQLLTFTRGGRRIDCYVRAWTSSQPMNHYRGITRIVIPTIHTISLDTLSYSFLASIHASLGSATIIWYHGIGPSFFSFIPKLFGKRVYTTIHALDWKRKKWGTFAKLFLRLCEHVALQFSDKLFVVSTQLQTYYQHQYHKDAIVEKYTIPHRVTVQASIIQQKYRLRKNTYVLYLGRFVPEKRLEWLIDASYKFPNLYFVLAGERDQSNTYAQHLMDMIHTQNIILTGYVLGKEKEELLSNCKLFILPSALEGYPISIMEAVSYGKHCLVGDFLRPEYTHVHSLIHYFKTDQFSDFIQNLRKLTQ